MEIHVGFYVTRNGRKAQVFSSTMPGKFPVAGVVFQTSTIWAPMKWYADGKWGDGNNTPADLIGEWRENED